MSLIDDCMSLGLVRFYGDSDDPDFEVGLTLPQLAALKALWLSGGQEPVAWLYFHSRGEPQLSVNLEQPDARDLRHSFDDDVVWTKPLYLAAPNVAEKPEQVKVLRNHYQQIWLSALKEFVDAQKPLPADMAKILYDNLWELYEGE